MKKILAGLFIVSMCATFTGCGNTTDDTTTDESTITDETGYVYNEGFPDIELTTNVPKPSFGDITYYDYGDSVNIYVNNAEASDVANYIDSLYSYGWNIDVSDENSDNSYFALNEDNQIIYVDYEDTTMTIYVYDTTEETYE